MDPQQRLLLETTWQAFENAGVDIVALSGKPVGVYVGGFTVDHLINQFADRNRCTIGAHSAAGATLTMLANRVSYAFNLTGPSLSVDTACSSSLVAFTLAVNDLRAARCDMAVVGGVNFMLRPEYVIAMCKGRFLAPDGRSKSFDAAADGYGRGEGCGVIVLKRGEDARGGGDEIVAYVDGVGTNQDGRTPGITVPNPKAQEALMREVLRNSDVDPATVAYVEAHGTGTPVGDPLEAAAIAAVYGSAERDTPVVIGSVKSNIGHLEAAAGVAGVIKAAWMLRRNQIPPIAGLKTPNPALPLHDRAIALATELRPLGDPAGERRVAVNSFGYGGTNAHVILRAATPAPVGVVTPEIEASATTLIAPASARTAKPLLDVCAALGEALDGPDAPDVLFTAARKRAHFERRAAVWGKSQAELAEGMTALGRSETPMNAVTGDALVSSSGRTAFVYTGMGPQWWGMGRGLWRENAVYRAALKEADALFQPIAGFSILDEMLRDGSASRIAQTEFAQPANFLLQMGLTCALAAEGLTPDAVVGHSVGEVSSAWASGMLPLEQSLTVSRHRSRVQAKAAGHGGMLATSLGSATAEAIADASGGRIDVAAINAPGAVTLAGEVEALKGLAAQLEDDGVFARMLAVEVPYHSAYMEPLKDELIDALSALQPVAPSVPLYSTVTGRRVETRRFDAEYWADNVREPVRFMAAIRRMLDDGITHFIEIGPHPVLSRAIRDVIRDADAQARHVATLSMKDDDAVALPRAVASSWVAGARIDWAARHPQGRLVPLPTYPFARETLWRESAAQHHDRLGFGLRAMAQEQVPGGPQIADLTVASLNFLHDHRVVGAAIMPAAGFLEAMLVAAEAGEPGADGWAACDVTIEAALPLDHARAQMLEVGVDAATGAAEVRSRDALSPDISTRHVSATLRALCGPMRDRVDPAALWALAPVGEDVDAAYQRFGQMGLDYGPAFRAIATLARDAARLIGVATLRLPGPMAADAARFLAHPTLIDGALQCALSLLEPGDGVFLPTGFDELRVIGALPTTVIARIDLLSKDRDGLICNIRLYDEGGTEVAAASGFRCAALTPPRPAATLPEADYAETWESVPAPATGPVPSVIIVGDKGDALPEALGARIATAGRPPLVACWDDPGLRTALHEAVYDVGLRACVVLTFDAGLAGVDDGASELAVRKLHGALVGFAAMRQQAPRIVAVTRGAAPVGGRMVPAQAAVTGFARVAHGELEDLTIDVVDVDADAPDLDSLLAAIAAPTSQRETAVRDGRWLAPVLRSSGVFAARPMVETRPVDGPLSLISEGLEQVGTCTPVAGSRRLRVEALCLPPIGESGVVGVVGRFADAPDHRVVAMLPDQVDVLRTEIVGPILTDVVVADWPEPLDAAAGALAVLTEGPAAALVQAAAAPAGGRAIVADTPLGATLSVRLERAGMAVVRLAADPDAWTETALGDSGAVDLIAAPMAAWSRRFGFARLRIGAALIDLDPVGSPFPVPAAAALVLRPRGARPAEVALAAAASAETSARASVIPLARWDGRRDGWRIVTVEPTARVMALADLRPALWRDGTWLVTGGFGALGGRAALWLAAGTAARVAVAGRRGAETPAAAELLTEIARLGAEPIPLALDMTDAAAVEAAVEALDTPEAPLRGVIHAAGALSDKPLLDMDDTDIATAMRAKTVGAMALDRATRGRRIEHFVLFSSIAVSVGNKRQANYVAANAVLDALAHARRGEGFPALSVNFGAISEVGMAADPAVEAHLRAIGLPLLAPDTALAGVGAALRAGATQVVAAAQPDWNRIVSHDPRGARTARLAELCGPHLDRLGGGRATAIRDQLLGAPHAQRVNALAALLAEVVAAELKLEAASLTTVRPFDEVGVDSLIAVDLQLAIELALGVNVSTMVLMGGATLNSVAAAVLVQMGLGGDAEQQPVTRRSAE